MDNISHSVVGLAFAESIYQCYEKKTNDANPLFRKCLWFLSFISSNFPDLDYLYVIASGWKRLGGLLHHRGHTHTFVMSVPQGLFLVFLFFLFSKRRKWVWSKRQRSLLAAVSILAICLHLGMDSLNSYGIHPFWPFDTRWYYADTLFIVEPYFWVGFTPLLFFAAKHILLRVSFLTLFISILVLCWISGLVLPELAAVVTLYGLLLAVLAIRTSKTRYLHAATWMGCFFFLGFFHKISGDVKAVAENNIKSENPGTVIHDVIVSPLPANPFCWGTLVVESLGPVTSYKIRRALTTPYPNFISFERCMKIEMAKPYLALGKPKIGTAQVHWFGFEEFSVEKFRDLAKKHCGFGAYLRFARAPAFVEKDGKLIVRDMRYDLRSPNFTEVEFPRDMAVHPGCSLGANWEYPRADLLGN